MHTTFRVHTTRYSLLLTIIFSLTLASCLREPDRDCPPEYRISLNVKDKNYSNIAEVSQLLPVDESLSFNTYVGNISYQLQNLENGEVMADFSASPVTSDQQLYTIETTNIPEGQYILTALGNTDATTLLREASIQLHANNQEHPDTYLSHDTLTLSAAATDHTLDMKRTKGLLLVLIENAPDSLTRVDEQINHVEQYINRSTAYSGETSINKSFTQTFAPSAALQTWVAPTVDNKKSTFRLTLFAQNKATPYSILPDIELIIKRNEITVIRVNFVPDGVEIWIYLYGSWQKLHNMDITTIN